MEQMNSKLWNELLRLGLAPHMRGTMYIHDAVLLWRPGAFITKELYPEVAKKRGTHWTRVERAVRYTIKYAWDHNRGVTGEIAAILGISRIAVAPSAAELIAALGVWLQD